MMVADYRHDRTFPEKDAELLLPFVGRCPSNRRQYRMLNEFVGGTLAVFADPLEDFHPMYMVWG